jgi:hypothetical protein
MGRFINGTAASDERDNAAGGQWFLWRLLGFLAKALEQACFLFQVQAKHACIEEVEELLEKISFAHC